ncbi:hypothetical protein AAGC94_21245 [Clostridium sporogenes]|uniref:hypothetical protein n=1 Tax=Clostridium sporogenes TaxID=1509 RepID=UPI00313D865D
MLKKTISDLENIKKETLEKMKLSEGEKRVTVHMGTCGIASGAREVLSSVREEIKKSQVKNVKVKTTACVWVYVQRSH